MSLRSGLRRLALLPILAAVGLAAATGPRDGAHDPRVLAQETPVADDCATTRDVVFDTLRTERDGVVVFFREPVSNAFVARGREAKVVADLKGCEPGRRIRACFDAADRIVRIVEFDPTPAPRPLAGPEAGPGAGPDAPPDPEFEALKRVLLELAPGDRIRIVAGEGFKGGEEFRVQEITGGDVRAVSVTEGGEPRLIEIARLRKLEIVARGEALAPADASPAYVPKVGDVVQVESTNLRGLVVEVKPAEVRIREFTSGPERFVAVRRDGNRFLELPVPFAPPPGGSSGDAPAAASSIKLERPPAGDLDAVSNEWRFPVTLSHNMAGTILAGAYLEIRMSAEGRLLSPAEEAEILKKWRADIDAVSPLRFRHGGKLYEGARFGSEYYIALVGTIGADEERSSFPPVFPGIPESRSWRTSLHKPRGVMRERYAPENIIAFKDARAIPILIEAFQTRPETVRIAALKAMSANGSKALLPFLLHALYIETAPEMADHIRRAIVAFGPAADDYLRDFVKTGAHTKPFVETGVIDREAVAEPSLLLAEAIRLLTTLGAEPAAPFILPHVRADDPRLKVAAYQYFIRIAPLIFLSQRMSAGSGEARDVLLEVDRQKPDTLRVFLESLGKGAEREFFDLLAGLTAEEARVRVLDRIRQVLADPELTSLLHPQLIELKIAYDRSKELRGSLEELRQKVAHQYVAHSLLAAGRHEQMSLLRRAIVLDPGNAEARRRVGQLLREIALEMQQGCGIRVGPGDDHRLIRLARAGEKLLADETRKVDGEWRPVKGVSSGPAWIHATSVTEAQGGYVVAQGASREVAESVRLLEIARGLNPDMAADVDRTLAAAYAAQGDARAAAGDVPGALSLYRRAAGLGSFREVRGRLALTAARAHPLLAGTALLILIAIPGTLIWFRRRRQAEIAEMLAAYAVRIARGARGAAPAPAAPAPAPAPAKPAPRTPAWKADRPAKVEKAPDKPRLSEAAEKEPEKLDRTERGERSDKVEKPEKAERPEKREVQSSTASAPDITATATAISPPARPPEREMAPAPAPARREGGGGLAIERYKPKLRTGGDGEAAPAPADREASTQATERHDDDRPFAASESLHIQESWLLEPSSGDGDPSETASTVPPGDTQRAESR